MKWPTSLKIEIWLVCGIAIEENIIKWFDTEMRKFDKDYRIIYTYIILLKMCYVYFYSSYIYVYMHEWRDVCLYIHRKKSYLKCSGSYFYVMEL